MKEYYEESVKPRSITSKRETKWQRRDNRIEDLPLLPSYKICQAETKLWISNEIMKHILFNKTYEKVNINIINLYSKFKIMIEGDLIKKQ